MYFAYIYMVNLLQKIIEMFFSHNQIGQSVQGWTKYIF